jgi:7-keto-8-aminopelargonate synthetase-like enzyme
MYSDSAQESLMLSEKTILPPTLGSDMAERIDSKHSSLSDYIENSSADLFDKTNVFARFHSDLTLRGYNKYVLPIREYRGGRVLVDDAHQSREMLMFCLADYLYLARSDAVRAAASEAVLAQGASVSGVPIIAGSTDTHKALEREVARFVGSEDCVLFPTGQAANGGAIAALCSARDYIVIDKQVHTSVLEGVKLSGSMWRTFRHSNPEHLALVLAGIRGKGHSRGILVIVEGVYGLDGDISPLPAIAEVTKRFGARLFVDDVHGTGVVGATGAGVHEYFGMACPDVLMGAFSKAMGSVGGWVATSAEVANYLRYYCGTLAFSTGISPSAVAAANTSLRIISSVESPQKRLAENACYLRDRLLDIGVENASRSASAIVSARIDSEPVLREVHKDLFERGVWVEALPFPATIRGQERIRLRARASHTRDDLDQAASAIQQVLKKHRILRLARTSNQGTSSVPDLAECIVSLAIREADEKGLRLSWASRDFYKRIAGRTACWADVDGQLSRWFTRGADELSACLLATAAVAQKAAGLPAATGFIGHIHYLPGHLLDIQELIAEAREWLSSQGVGHMVGPVQVPMQVLGAGILGGDARDPPFLEPLTDSAVAEAFLRAGFQPSQTNSYKLCRFGEEVSQLSLRNGLRLRMLRKEAFDSEIRALAAAFNEGIGMLPLCSQIGPATLAGIASELRELIIPEFWWLVEDSEGAVLAFAGGFPDLGQAFSTVGGTGDISDTEYLRIAIDGARRGFIAWASVRRDHAGRGLVEAASAKVLACMKWRGYVDVWTSWELVDAGPVTLGGLIIERHLGFQVFERSGSKSIPARLSSQT